MGFFSAQNGFGVGLGAAPRRGTPTPSGPTELVSADFESGVYTAADEAVAFSTMWEEVDEPTIEAGVGLTDGTLAMSLALVDPAALGDITVIVDWAADEPASTQRMQFGLLISGAYWSRVMHDGGIGSIANKLAAFSGSATDPVPAGFNSPHRDAAVFTQTTSSTALVASTDGNAVYSASATFSSMPPGDLQLAIGFKAPHDGSFAIKKVSVWRGYSEADLPALSAL